MKKRLNKEEGDSECYGRDLQVEIRRVSDDSLAVGNYLSAAKKELGQANVIRNNLVDELNEGRNMREERKRSLEEVLRKNVFKVFFRKN